MEPDAKTDTLVSIPSTKIDWRTHDYGDAVMDHLRQEQKRLQTKLRRLNAQVNAAREESNRLDVEIHKQAVKLLVGKPIRLVPGATNNPDLRGDGELLGIKRTAATVRFNEKLWRVPWEWIKPNDDNEWFTWCFIGSNTKGK